MSAPSQIPDALRASVQALPVLPTAVTRLLTITQQPEVSVGEIARVIESDPTLMARTLRVANSPLYSTGRAIKTAQQATVLLGIEAVVNLALGVSVASVQEQLHEQLPIDAEAFGRHSIAVALASRKLARHVKLPHPGEAFVAGLLHDIGKLVLLMHHGEAYADVMRRAQQGEEALDALEKETFDLDHAAAGHALCLHWNVPASMAEAVAAHHAEPGTHPVGDVVRKANNLVKTIQIGFSGNRFISAAPGQPGDLTAQGWLRALILNLSEEIEQAEEALGYTSGSSPYAAKKKAARPLVQLQIDNPGEQAVLMSMLLALDFEPTTLADSSIFDGPARPIALVTDSAPSDRQQQAYEQLGVAVFDYAAFRQTHHIAPGQPLDVYLLWTWLSGL